MYLYLRSYVFISLVTSQQVLLICDMECSQYPPEGSDREGRARDGGNEGPRQIWRGFAWYAGELRPNEIRAVSTQPSHHASLSRVTGSLMLTDLYFESVNPRHS